MSELSLRARMRMRVFGVSEDEVSMERRGFTAIDDRAREQLERVALVFLEGYHAALCLTDHAALARRLDATDAEFRGFAHEGAAMGLTVLDGVLPGSGRLRSFLSGPGFPYAWMAPIGFGWARAQMRRRPRRPHPLVDPLLDWFEMDGAGFHDGYFQPNRFIEDRHMPRHLSGTAARVYDQGIGRSLWFVRGADVERIGATVDRFPANRRPDIWSGVSSAASYAGGVGEDALLALRREAHAFPRDVAQGAAFAIKARVAGGNITPHTELASSVFCQMPVAEVARCTDMAREGAVAGYETPFDAWRDRIRAMICDGERPGNEPDVLPDVQPASLLRGA
ncbi:MAG TPA: DUF1702 family protein [Solirubrobacterales bacterium]